MIEFSNIMFSKSRIYSSDSTSYGTKTGLVLASFEVKSPRVVSGVFSDESRISPEHDGKIRVVRRLGERVIPTGRSEVTEEGP